MSHILPSNYGVGQTSSFREKYFVHRRGEVELAICVKHLEGGARTTYQVSHDRVLMLTSNEIGPAVARYNDYVKMLESGAAVGL